MAEDSLTAADFMALPTEVLVEAEAEETHLEKQLQVSSTGDSSHLEQVLSEVPTVTLLFRTIIARRMAK